MAHAETATRTEGPPELIMAVTEAARDKLLGLLQDQEPRPRGLRVSVSGGGCSGFQYTFAFENEAMAHDQVLEAENYRLFVDNVSAGYLDGSELDYVSTLMTEGFHIRNPNATGTCGCGLSVSF